LLAEEGEKITVSQVYKHLPEKKRQAKKRQQYTLSDGLCLL